MKVKILFSVLMLNFATTALASGNHHHSHNENGNTSMNMQHQFAAGQPGMAAEVDRTIKIKAMDTMRYDQNEIQVKAGETIRFIVTNTGNLAHEFSIGDVNEQKEHADMMKQMPNMKHEDPNTLSLKPKETGEIIWKFKKSSDIEIACHVAGHYEAGMKANVLISR